VKLGTKTKNTNQIENNDYLYPIVGKNLDMLTLEQKVLEFWDKHEVFNKRVELNSQSKKRYSFMDGPITANNPMGLHHTWGRSLKDMIQRYWSLKGYKQRFQNGFDCQGLWIEVEVEKALGLNSKRAIEEYGLNNFAEKCKKRVDKYSKIITKESIRLGQWMHWDNSYYTHTDTNISYIWYFLKVCQEKGWLIKGHLPMPWCSRCGTSLSQHEQADSYEVLTHTSLYAKFPLKTDQANKKEKEFLLVWTTTPWTLTANTAVAVHPKLTYVKVLVNEQLLYLAKSRLAVLSSDYEVLEELPGKKLVNRKYETPFSDLTAQKEVDHLVVPWKEVSENEGSGFVHIAPGCGAEDFELSKERNLAVLTPIDEHGIFVKEFDYFSNKPVKEVSKEVEELLESKDLLFLKEEFTHRYPTCWRCHEELVFRLVEEYFIDCEEIRPLLKKAAKKVIWTPTFYGKRMQDWLDNMGNWCISRKRYWGLPLPFFDCKECGELTVIGSKEELLKAAVEGTDNLPELHRPWIDDVKIKCPKCDALVQKVSEVGDCWLDAGIVPFSTMKYIEDPEYWKQWFPIETVCEMREQIRLWFYAQLFMSVALTNEPPYKQVVVHEKVNDKDGREMHKSWGNAIWLSEAVNKIGADVIRWSFAKSPLHQTANFGYNVEDEVKPYFLTLWNIYSFFATFANLDRFNPNKTPKVVKLNKTNQPLLDRWLLSRVNLLVKEVRKELDKANIRNAVLCIEQFVEILSTWYVRRSRRRFWKNENSHEKFSAYTSLYNSLLIVIKLMAPIVPFFSEALYQNLVRIVDPKSPISVHLTDYPKVNKKLIDVQLNQEMDLLLNAVKLGRAARSKADIRLRQPLAELKLYCKQPSNKDVLLKFKQELLSELNVKRLKFVDNPEKLFELRLKPNYRVLGPVLKNNMDNLVDSLKQLQQVDIMEAYYHPEQNLELTINGLKKPLTLNLMNDLVVEINELGSFAVTIGDDLAVALKTKLTPELELEGLARDIVRHIQNLRKLEDLQVNDKITTYYQGSKKILTTFTKFAEYIKTETLTKELKKTTKKKANRLSILGEELILSIEKN